MMRQTDIIADKEADNWFARNCAKLPNPDDPVLRIIKHNELQFKCAIELGCANGWRLAELKKRRPPPACIGYDLSLAALTDGRRQFPDVHLYYGDAAYLRYSKTDEADLVILGFFLYVVDRCDLFRITAETDRVLKNGGHLIIFDFIAGWPHATKYAHDQRIRTYKMKYADLWLANPAYRLADMWHCPKEEHGVWLLRKDLSIWRDTD